MVSTRCNSTFNSRLLQERHGAKLTDSTYFPRPSSDRRRAYPRVHNSCDSDRAGRRCMQPVTREQRAARTHVGRAA